jgi:DNA-binding CsgD family transcriptional regulator
MGDHEKIQGIDHVLASDTPTPDAISVGLAISDRTLRLRVLSMISQMAAVDIANTNDADVILTDSDNAHAGPHLVLVDPVSLRSTMNGVDKGAGIYVLEAAIRLVAHGYRISVPRIKPSRSWDSAYDDLTPDTAELLTLRERQVLQKLAAGASNKIIARDLEISHATAKFHVSSLLTKLGARNRTDAVAMGLKFGLLLL